jgi:transposase
MLKARSPFECSPSIERSHHRHRLGSTHTKANDLVSDKIARCFGLEAPRALRQYFRRARRAGAAERLIRRVESPKCMLGDTAYDSAELRGELDEHGTKPVIPNRSNRKQPFSFNKRLYKLRWRIEAAFNRLKDFRRIATRYDKLALNYLASMCLAAALVWWI